MFILAAAGFLPLLFLLAEEVKNGRFMNKGQEYCAIYTKTELCFCDAENECDKYFKILNIKSKYWNIYYCAS